MGFIADGIKAVGKAIGGAVESVSKAVGGIAKSVGGIASAVSDLCNSPLGKMLSVVPGIGSMVSMVGRGADLVKGVAGHVGNVADFAQRFGQSLIGGGAGASACMSPTGLGFLGAAVQNFNSMDGLLGLSQGLSPAFGHLPGMSDVQDQIAQFAPWNVAQMLAKRQAELMPMY